MIKLVFGSPQLTFELIQLRNRAQQRCHHITALLFKNTNLGNERVLLLSILFDSFLNSIALLQEFVIDLLPENKQLNQ